MDEYYHEEFTESMEGLEWCEECQNWYPVGEDGTVLCECDFDFNMEGSRELDFN